MAWNEMEGMLSYIDKSVLSMDDIAVCVFTSALNLRERALSIHNTWLKRFPKGYLVGGYYHDHALKMISLGKDVGEDYQSATRKQFFGIIELFNKFPDAKWFYVTGCDAYVFAENLKTLLSAYNCNEDLLIGGSCGDIIINHERVIYPGGGPGFALSKSIVKKIIARIPSFVEEWERTQTKYKSACDAAMAYLLQHEYGIRLTYREGFYFGPSYDYPKNSYKDSDGNDIFKPVVKNPIAFHSLSIREIYLLDLRSYLNVKTFGDKIFDKLSLFLTKRLKTRNVVNILSKLIYGYRFR